jgi:hypothetical protein
MILSAMRTEVQARGYDHISTTRVDQFLNDTYFEICDAMPWPFLETSVTGTSPLTITDLGKVLSVVDSLSDVSLTYADRRNVTAEDADLSDLGTPWVWWKENNTITVYPGSSTDTVTVRYIKVPTVLTAADTPAIPDRYHMLIVHGAVAQAQLDDDNYDAYQATRAVFKERLDMMIANMMGMNLSGPGLMLVTQPQDF